MKRLMLFQLFAIQALWMPGQQPFPDMLPDHWFAWSKEQVRCNEEQGNFEENLEIFRLGHQKGFFYFLHPALPRYKPYLEFSGFDSIVVADRTLYLKALEQSITRYKLEFPDSYDPRKNYPLFIIFHGGNSNFKRVWAHWKEEALDSSFIKVYLQSYRHFDSESFTWRSGDKRADRDLLRIYEEIVHTCPVDSSRVIVAGISAGANYAIGMALRGIIPVSGFLAFCPGLPQEFKTDPMPPASLSSIRGYILGGEHDFYREQQAALIAMFTEMGLHYVYVIEEQMGHQYPDDESKYIREGLQFIMKN